LLVRGANLTGGPLSQSQPKVQQQPLGALADSSEGEWFSPLHRETVRPRQDAVSTRLGVKATTLKAKAKAKDLASKAKGKAKDLAFEAKAKAKDLAFEAKAKAKDLAFKAKAKAKDDVKANVNMVRCSVKTSKHRRLLQGW